MGDSDTESSTDPEIDRGGSAFKRIVEFQRKVAGVNGGVAEEVMGGHWGFLLAMKGTPKWYPKTNAPISQYGGGLKEQPTTWTLFL